MVYVFTIGEGSYENNPRIFYTCDAITDSVVMNTFSAFKKDTYSSTFYLYKCDLFEVELLLSNEDGFVVIEDVQYEHLRPQLED
jgi:hypothetical protein